MTDTILDATINTRPTKAREMIAINKALVETIKSRDLTEAQRLIQLGADVNYFIQTRNSQMSVLMFAIDCSYYDMAALLIERGADPNKSSYSNANKATVKPLFRCVVKDQNLNTESLLRTLVKHGADLNIVAFGGLTPLTHALTRGKEEVVDLLFDLGSKLRMGLSQFDDALLVAKQMRSDEMVAKVESLLLRQAAKINNSPDSVLKNHDKLRKIRL